MIKKLLPLCLLLVLSSAVSAQGPVDPPQPYTVTGFTAIGVDDTPPITSPEAYVKAVADAWSQQAEIQSQLPWWHIVQTLEWTSVTYTYKKSGPNDDLVEIKSTIEFYAVVVPLF